MTNRDVNEENGGISKDEEYRNILRELGIEKLKGEPITKKEFGYIFLHTQESFGMGS